MYLEIFHTGGEELSFPHHKSKDIFSRKVSVSIEIYFYDKYFQMQSKRTPVGVFDIFDLRGPPLLDDDGMMTPMELYCLPKTDEIFFPAQFLLQPHVHIPISSSFATMKCGTRTREVFVINKQLHHSYLHDKRENLARHQLIKILFPFHK